MKNLFFVCILLLGAHLSSNAQVFDWGIKGGLNYNSNGDIVNEAGNILENPEANAGYHIGFFAKTKGRIYIRPELVYTHTNSNYDSKKLKIDKIDAPVLLGVKIIGPLHAVIGPSFQYIINTDLESFNLSDVENDFTVGGTVGLTVQLGKLGIDVRYERGFTSNEADFLNIGEIASVDTRPSQLIASASFRF
ncbi:MAG: PorT family protein [Urechidicola sp.]|nr:PorT family protein [Urechidicola sp.]